MSKENEFSEEEILEDNIEEIEELEAEEIDLAEEASEETAEESEEEEELNEVQRLAKALQESDERYLRLVAEYENYRKRTSKEKSEIYPAATCDTVSKFLPILDNFERALQFEPCTEDYTKGIEMIYRNFTEALASIGAEAFGEVGDSFDPELHNAVMHIEDPDLGENVVAMVMQKGYRMGDRIIRHAMVQTAN